MIELRVRRHGKTLKGFAAVAEGKVTRTHFMARLRGVPAGGPYDIEVQLLNEEPIGVCFP